MYLWAGRTANVVRMFPKEISFQNGISSLMLSAGFSNSINLVIDYKNFSENFDEKATGSRHAGTALLGKTIPERRGLRAHPKTALSPL
jgi:hypothetical protein